MSSICENESIYRSEQKLNSTDTIRDITILFWTVCRGGIKNQTLNLELIAYRYKFVVIDLCSFPFREKKDLSLEGQKSNYITSKTLE